MSEDQTTQTTSSSSTKKSSFPLKNILVFTLFLGLAGSLFWGYQSNNKYKDAQEQINLLSSVEGQQEVAKQEIQAIVEKVKTHMELPEGEDPAMATVLNAESLASEQPFYKDATNGDKVIVYQKANKAILYNPEKDIVVNVDDFVIAPATGTPEGSPQATPDAMAPTDAMEDTSEVPPQAPLASPELPL
jgi:hypothetical protein